MKRRSDQTDNWDAMRAKIIGLGEQSIQKSYYPELQQRLNDLEHFRTLLDHSIDGIILVQVPSGISIDVNQSLCDQMGYSREEILSTPFLNLLLPPEPPQLLELLLSGRAIPGQNVRVAVFLKKRNGDSVPVEMNVTLVELSGSLYSVVVMRDITERMLAEDALKKSEAKLRRITENARDMIYRMSLPDGRYEYVSPASVEITGYSPEEFYNNLLFIRTIIHPEWLDYFEREWINIQNGKAKPFYEYKIIHKTGEERWVHQRNVFEYDGKGQPVAIEGIVTDMTEPRRIAEEKKKLEAQLAQMHKMDAIGTLAGGIAHDFNNILSAIIGYTELAVNELTTNPEKSHTRLKAVLKASDRAKSLVRQILSFSRKTETAYSPISLASVVKETLKMLRAIIPSTIEIRQDISISGTILSDPTQINQIIMNLCTNAVHAMEDYGGVLDVQLQRVSIDYQTALSLKLIPGNYMRLMISDTGHGIDPELIENIFDPYFTTKELGRGTGLGLSVVHGIVSNHNGAITCRSTPGKGTTFDIYLPETESSEESAVLELKRDFSTGKERILFIDDDPMLANLGRDILTGLKYNVVAMTDSIEALNLFRKDPSAFDLVITDYTMPGMTGDRLISEILKIRDNIPVILCTGYSENMTEEKAKSIGALEFIVKPIEINDFAEIIRNIFDSRNIKDEGVTDDINLS